MTMVIVRKDGRDVCLKPKPFEDEQDLKRQLLSNLNNIIPAKDISEEDDERIVAWRSEFPLEVGSIDLLAVGDGGGIYLVETKLFRNQDRRKVIAQALDYVAGLWREYAQDIEGFLEKLREDGEGEVPEDEEFEENLERNIGAANYYILIAMDSITPQVKDLVKFLNGHTDFKVIILEVARYVGEGLEVVLPQIYGEEIPREPPVRKPLSPLWSLEQLKTEFENVPDINLRDRLLKILEWAESKGVFDQSRGKVPGFSLKTAGGKVFGISAKGDLYASFGRIESGKYSSDEERYEFVEGLKALGLLPQDIDPGSVKSQRKLTKRLNQLTEEEFNSLLGLLERILVKH